MQEFLIWPKNMDWQEVARSFLIISIIGFLVSFILNKEIKNSPIFAVQLSILLSLFIYPLIDTYLHIATVSHYNLDADIIGFPRAPLIFFIPLPICTLVAVIFYIYREKENIHASDSEAKIYSKRRTRFRVAAFVLSVLAGGVWLTFAMALEKTLHQLTVLRFLCYTVYGFTVYLVVELILSIIRLLFAAKQP